MLTIGVHRGALKLAPPPTVYRISSSIRTKMTFLTQRNFDVDGVSGLVDPWYFDARLTGSARRLGSCHFARSTARSQGGTDH